MPMDDGRLHVGVLTHHNGFMLEMEDSFSTLDKSKFHFTYIHNIITLKQAIDFYSMVKREQLLPLDVPAFEGFKLPDGYTFQDIRDMLAVKWGKFCRPFFQQFNDMYKWGRLDVLILGIGGLQYDMIRRECPDLPVLFYPRMPASYWELAFINPEDDKFIEVGHDMKMLDYPYPSKYRRVITASVRPDLYHSWTGEKAEVLTLFQGIDTRRACRFPAHMNTSLTMTESYEQVVDGFPSQLIGGTDPPGWHGAFTVKGRDVPKTIRSYRCAFQYSRQFSAIASAQLAATGVPLIGWVDDYNEIADIDGTLVSTDVKECREHIDRLLRDHDYAKSISKQTRESYYATHDWKKFQEQWHDLLLEVANV